MPALALALLVAAPVQLTLAAESKLWIDGDSNLRAWACQAATILTETDADGGEPGTPPSVKKVLVAVPVEDLHCGDDMMDDKLREALKADQFPLIDYALLSIEPLEGAPPGEYRLQATGRLTIAGRTRTITTVVAAGAARDGTLSARGSAPLSMRDFGIDPPTALFGILKTYDRIVVSFDLKAHAVGAQLTN